MDLHIVTMALLVLTLALQVGHVLIHVMTTYVWKAEALPWYDAHVGYLGAFAWFLMVIFDLGTLAVSFLVAVPVGLLLCAVGFYVHGRGIMDILAHGEDGALVTQGIYAKLRHPIYYGWVLVSFGMPLLLLSHWGLITAPLWSGLIIAVGLMEERDMRRRYPEEYDAYARTTVI